MPWCIMAIYTLLTPHTPAKTLQICSKFAANLQQICSNFAAMLLQLCSTCASTFIHHVSAFHIASHDIVLYYILLLVFIPLSIVCTVTANHFLFVRWCDVGRLIFVCKLTLCVCAVSVGITDVISMASHVHRNVTGTTSHFAVTFNQVWATHIFISSCANYELQMYLETPLQVVSIWDLSSHQKFHEYILYECMISKVNYVFFILVNLFQHFEMIVFYL